ncbi:MAG: DNA methyltransferase [Steroidobacteraceae bacterium]
MRPEQFISKWAAASLTERSAAQQHFLDLCLLLGEPPPAEADPTGDTFTFEKGGTTATGGHGWADVWKKGAFAWEYKGPGKDLQQAYYQLKKYADALENPPLLITSDLKRIEIHTNFTNTVKKVYVLELVDLGDPAKRELLRQAFREPERLRPGLTRQMVTKKAAERFSELAHHLQEKTHDPHRVAHFLNRLIFCMFAEDVGLLPNRIFSKLITASVAHPETFETNAQQLFAGMARGGSVAFEVIDFFNGGLFDDASTLPLDKAELKLVLACADLDWTDIEPSIFGTLFERGLDPDKRSQQGAHYTDPETIMKIVRPVVLDHWEREWAEEKDVIAKLVGKATRKISEAALKRYFSFLEHLHQFRVLDPACGSGNFLYLALRGLKDFEKRVILEAEALGLPRQFPRVGPEALLGIEVNPYAAELARVTIWIGEIQWMIENGFNASKNPILKPLDQIECRDAIINEDSTEPEWPTADAIVGNPPFLGGKLLRNGLGDDYVNRLFDLYQGRVPAEADLVTYWFEKAARQLEAKKVGRVGLVATNSIRGGPNRRVLQRAMDLVSGAI